MRIGHIRHLNRGDIKEGGCSLCKPRRSREDRIRQTDIIEAFLAAQDGEFQDKEETESNDT